jgi:hypothetical protein
MDAFDLIADAMANDLIADAMAKIEDLFHERAILNQEIAAAHRELADAHNAAAEALSPRAVADKKPPAGVIAKKPRAAKPTKPAASPAPPPKSSTNGHAPGGGMLTLGGVGDPGFAAALRQATIPDIIKALETVRGKPGQKKRVEKLEARLRKLNAGLSGAKPAAKKVNDLPMSRIVDTASDNALFRALSVDDLDLSSDDSGMLYRASCDTVGETLDALNANEFPTNVAASIYAAIDELRDRLARNAKGAAAYDAEKTAAAASRVASLLPAD